jgi:hypothetical protein
MHERPTQDKVEEVAGEERIAVHRAGGWLAAQPVTKDMKGS